MAETDLGGGYTRSAQNLTDGVNRLGHKGAQLGDPNPNQDWVLGPS